MFYWVYEFHFEAVLTEEGYKFNYPVTISVDSLTREPDKEAYRNAFKSFISSLLFDVSFVAPQILKVRMSKRKRWVE